MSAPRAAGPPAPHPSAALRARLLGFAEELARSGQEAPSRTLRATVEAWWGQEQAWLEGVVNVLRIHHDINNALVGVRGNAQLLLMAPVAEQPNVRDRLEVILRESARIKDAATRINELKASITGQGPSARAA